VDDSKSPCEKAGATLEITSKHKTPIRLFILLWT